MFTYADLAVRSRDLRRADARLRFTYADLAVRSRDLRRADARLRFTCADRRPAPVTCGGLTPASG